MTLDWSLLSDSRKEYARGWQAIDWTLYELCRKYPDHEDEAGVRAKLWLIGRTFATGIERVIPSDRTQGSSMGKLARHVFSRHAQVDRIVKPLRSLSGPLTRQKLETILAGHHEFVQFLSTFIRSVSPDGKAKEPHSFASKYLHFHCPLVPIFDSVANTELRSLVPMKKVTARLDSGGKRDEVYAGYASRFWQLYKMARTAGFDSNVRDLEFFVLWCAERRIASSSTRLPK